MYKKSIKYVDFDGVERSEDFYFNMNKSEFIEWEMTVEGGLKNQLVAIARKKDKVEMYKFFKEFILRSYGEKSPDGKHFMKSEEISNAFTNTNAYDSLIIEFFTNEDAAVTFFNSVVPDIPKEQRDEAEKQLKAEMDT